MAHKVSWASPQLAPLVLISGTEAVTADRAMRMLRTAARAQDPEVEVSRIDASAYTPGALLDAAGPSLFGQPRFIEVLSVERCVDAFLEDALNYAASPEPDVVVVLRHAGGNRARRLLDAVRKASGAVEVECQAITRDADKVGFVQAEFQAARRRIEPDALRRLVDAFSTDLAEMASACQQLIADVPGDVGVSDVDEAFGARVEVTAFTVAGLAIAGRTGDALVSLRHAREAGATPVPMVAVFATKIRLMAKVAGAHGGNTQLAKLIGAAPWQIQQARRDAQGWTQAQLLEAIRVVAATDAAVKGESRDPDFAVEQMVRCVSERVPLPIPR